MSAERPPPSSLWDGDYDVVELRLGRDGAPPVVLPAEKVPPVAHVELDRRSATVWVQGTREDGYPMAFGIATPGGSGGTLSALYVAIPLIAGTSMYSLYTSRAVRWLDLEVGQSDAAITLERSHKVATACKAPTRWTVDVTLERTPPIRRWLAPLSVTIETDAPRPPWQRMTVEFACEAARAHATGSFELRRLPAEATAPRQPDTAQSVA